MRKGITAAVTAAALMIAALVCLGIFLAVRVRQDLTESDEIICRAEEDAETAILSMRNLSGESQSGSLLSDSDQADSAFFGASDNIAPGDTLSIWVGDSRTLGMKKAVEGQSGDIFIGAEGEGYYWLNDYGIDQLKEAISEYPDRPVIFNMGVNDYENLYNYLNLYKELTSSYPDSLFCFLSVNPVDDEQCEYISNSMIEDFNSYIESAYPDTYIDSYSYLMEIGPETIDGIHYSEEYYRLIYSFVKEELLQLI